MDLSIWKLASVIKHRIMSYCGISALPRVPPVLEKGEVETLPGFKVERVAEMSTWNGTFPFELLRSPGAVSLDIGIVGAGIAGLGAAIALRKSGHRVEVFEKSRFKNEIGAAINVCPNATRLLTSYGFDFARTGSVPVEQSNFLDGRTTETTILNDWTQDSHKYGAPWYFMHRADLHAELRRVAEQHVKINLGADVVDVDVDEGTMTFADGTVIHKDLIVVSDGVHSTLAPKVVGKEIPASHTQVSTFRFLLPTEQLMADPVTRPFFENQPAALRISNLPDNRKFVVYPCRSGRVQNCLLIYPTRSAGGKREEWHNAGSIEDLLKYAEGFHPMLQAIVRKAEEVKQWPLFFRPPIDKWVKGKVVLIGDAAHPMLPYQGQGAGQALEDGAALAVFLSQVNDINRLPSRLTRYERCRRPRAAAMQIFSNVTQDQAEDTHAEVRKYVQGPIPCTVKDFWEWNYSYDVVNRCLQELREEQMTFA